MEQIELPTIDLRRGDALDRLLELEVRPHLIATDPPYAFGGSGDEHAISATVAVVLRESAIRLEKGGWMLVMCASSWRSMAYMAESVRGCGLEPVRVGTWAKPRSRTKTRTPGWAWASVKVLAFRKGKSIDIPTSDELDHICAEPVMNGRRAELPACVADWMVRPYAIAGQVMLDPFAGSGALCLAAERAGMRAVGFERQAS